MSHVASAVTNPAVQDSGEQVRADCYRVLARLFAAPPDAALLATLSTSASGADDTLGQLWNELCKVDAGESVRLADEYAALFTSVGEPRVFLYGSWYQSGSLMDTPLADLRTDLTQLGFARQSEVREPEDHFAALLEVMALLVTQGNPAQHAFFARHIAPWYLKFCARLAAEANESSEFFRAAANFACGFLEGEAELLAS